MTGLERYNYYWGKFKSDKYKTKKTLTTEIRDIIALGTYSKNELIILKEIFKDIGFYKNRSTIALKDAGFYYKKDKKE